MAAKQTYKTSKIFVPGGMPSLTYVTRIERDLERRLAAAKDNLCKLVTLTGTTKSGKTVLANRVFPRSSKGTVWVDGGTVASEDDLWTTILGELGGAVSTEFESTTESGTTFAAEGQAGLKVPLFAKASAKGSLAADRRSGKAQKRSLTKTPRAAAIAELRSTQSGLIIDDFHYLDRTLQGSVVRALKPLIFGGQTVIFIAIPHRRYDVVRVEKEMTGRLDDISVPSWTRDELMEISKTGFPLLNVEVSKSVVEKMALEAYASPHLMQEFCRSLATGNNITETQKSRFTISEIKDSLFQSVAEGTGKVIFDKLKKGPRQRSDRKPRPIVAGGSADVYEAVLAGLASLSPGLERVEYEQLRGAIKSVLADNIPQAHEISRVLERMSEIASSDEASTPVLDWDKEERQLHITDPFFAFFLKWRQRAN